VKWKGRRQSSNVIDKRRDKQRQRKAGQMVQAHGEFSFPSPSKPRKPPAADLAKKTGMPNDKKPRLARNAKKNRLGSKK